MGCVVVQSTFKGTVVREVLASYFFLDNLLMGPRLEGLNKCIFLFVKLFELFTKNLENSKYYGMIQEIVEPPLLIINIV
jgi:hypothetical protein